MKCNCGFESNYFSNDLGDYYFEEKELYMCPECNTLIVRVDE